MPFRDHYTFWGEFISAAGLSVEFALVDAFLQHPSFAFLLVIVIIPLVLVVLVALVVPLLGLAIGAPRLSRTREEDFSVNEIVGQIPGARENGDYNGSSRHSARE